MWPYGLFFLAAVVLNVVGNTQKASFGPFSAEQVSATWLQKGRKLCPAAHVDAQALGCYHANTITLVLTVYKRDHILEQLAAAQALRPSVIYIWQNGKYVNIQKQRILTQYPPSNNGIPIEFLESSANFKFHGRFALPLMFTTEYTAI